MALVYYSLNTNKNYYLRKFELLILWSITIMYSVSTPQKGTKPQTLTKKTLDVQHGLKLKQFQEKEALAGELHEQLSFLQAHLYDLNARRLDVGEGSDMDQETMFKIVEVQDQILTIKRHLVHMDGDVDEIEYLINTGGILFQYYDIIDKGSSFQEETLLLSKKKPSDNGILRYLMQGEKRGCTDCNNPSNPENSNRDRASLLEKYLAYTENNYVKPFDEDPKEQCPHCTSANRNIMLNDGLIYCNDCFTVEYIIVDHDRPSYKDPPKEVTYFSYKRLNHFNEFFRDKLQRIITFWV